MNFPPAPKPFAKPGMVIKQPGRDPVTLMQLQGSNVIYMTGGPRHPNLVIEWYSYLMRRQMKWGDLLPADCILISDNLSGDLLENLYP